MFYEVAKGDHGLRHDPFKALTVPRPIGWISSLDGDGVCNLAPYSFFNAVATRPHYVMFSSEGPKDSLKNVEATGEFVCSLATWDLRDHMNVTSAPVPPGVDEFPLAGLTAAASHVVRPPRVKESPASFECRYWKTLEIPGWTESDPPASYVVFGQVVGIYVDDRFIEDGLVKTPEMAPIARLGYMDYAVIRPDNTFAINRPEVDESGNLRSRSAAAWDGVYR